MQSVRNADHTTRRTTPHPAPNARHATQRNPTRESIFDISVSPTLQRCSSTAPTSLYLQHRGISGAGYLQHRGMSETSRYLGHRGISNIAVFARVRIEIFGKPGPWRPWRVDYFLEWSSNGNPSQTWPGAAPGAGGAFSIGFLLENCPKSGPGRLRRPGGHFLLDF